MKNSEQPSRPWNPNRPWNNESANGFAGLTKREYFAGLAMTGLLSNSGHVQTFAGNRPDPVPSYIAEIAIDLADALLKQLEKSKP